VRQADARSAELYPKNKKLKEDSGMSTSPKPAQRGSAKLFAIDLHDHEALAHAVGAARSDYEVKWWWKYGTPVIDLLRVTIEVEAKQFGPTLTKFMQQNGREMQVTAECFPYGIVAPDRYRVELAIRNAG
jgi:hypothetical protein